MVRSTGTLSSAYNIRSLQLFCFLALNDFILCCYEVGPLVGIMTNLCFLALNDLVLLCCYEVGPLVYYNSP